MELSETKILLDCINIFLKTKLKHGHVTRSILKESGKKLYCFYLTSALLSAWAFRMISIQKKSRILLQFPQLQCIRLEIYTNLN